MLLIPEALTALSLLQFPRAYSFYRITLLMVLLLVFASEDSLLYTCKTLKPYRTYSSVSECVGAFTQQLIDLIKSFIIYLLPLFVITSKRIFKKIQMYKTTKKLVCEEKEKQRERERKTLMRKARR